uniref:Uncharacterized protein n=1 Tax=Ditylenchus dipsaci TaxID=166011 RepID=A0A915EPH2_9BILA
MFLTQGFLFEKEIDCKKDSDCSAGEICIISRGSGSCAVYGSDLGGSPKSKSIFDLKPSERTKRPYK